MIAAGILRHRVTIQESTAVNVGGVPVGTWTDVATVWASVEDLSGRELLAGQQIAADVTTKIAIRWRSGISPQMRAISGTRVFDIQAAIDPEGRKREMHLMCKERVQEQIAATSIWLRQEPTGARNGANTSFSLARPVSVSTAQLVWNGLIVAPDQYAIAGIALTTEFAPAADDTLFVYGLPVARYTPTGTRNGINMAFALPVALNAASAQVVWNGTVVAPDQYVLEGTTLTTLFAPAADDTLYCFG